MDLAYLYQRQSKNKEAQEYFDRAIAVSKVMSHEMPAYQLALVDLGSYYEKIGNMTESEKLLRAAVALVASKKPDFVCLASLNQLALCLQHSGHTSEAEALFKRSLEYRKVELELDPWGIADGDEQLATFYFQQTKYSEAEKYFRVALDLKHTARKAYTAEMVASLRGLYECCKRLGKLDEAKRFLQIADSVTAK
jgi:tetratricopeptide (TPR) repeat protein